MKIRYLPSQIFFASLALRCLFSLVLLSAAPGSAPAQVPALTECKQAFYKGDYARAVQRAEARLRLYPKDVPVRVLLARAELAQDQHLKAFEELKKALEFDPKNIDALYYLALVSRELSRSEYQRLFALAPDSFRVHQLLAEAALGAENPSEAENQFNQALEREPKSVEVLTGLGELKRSQSKFDEAIEYYAQAEKSGPLNYDIAYGLGACYTYKQEYAQAIEWLSKAAALEPNIAAGRFALANALFQEGQFEAAIPELQESLRLEPRMRQAYFLLGRAFSKLGRPEDARAAIKKLDELNRSDMPGQTKAPAGVTPPGAGERN
jgi:tetratricopeptide (TPR) repeat protein